MKKLLIALCLSVLALSAAAAPKQYSVSSPDGKLVVKVYTGENLSYAVSAEGTCLVAPSEISMTLSDGTVYGGAAKVQKAATTKNDKTIRPVVYKEAEVRDCYNELALTFKDFILYFRAYDSGVAYRFVSRSKADFTVKAEKAEFLFPQDWNMFVSYVDRNLETLETQLFNSFENVYKYEKISAKATVNAGTDDKGRGRILGIVLDVTVHADEEYEDLFDRVAKVMRKGCLISASLEPAFPVTYNLELECPDD